MGPKLLIFLCGVATATLTACLGAWIIHVTGKFSLTQFSIGWIAVLPLGGIGFGWLSVSGFWIANHILKKQLGWFVLLEMLTVAVGTFILIYYLAFLYDGNAAKAGRSFIEYVSDLWANSEMSPDSIESERHGFSFQVPDLGLGVKLGPWGLIFRFLDVAGFGLGALIVFRESRRKSP